MRKLAITGMTGKVEMLASLFDNKKQKTLTVAPSYDFT